MFVDIRTAPKSVAARVVREAGGVYAYSNRQIDQQPVGDLIEARLEELERTARVGGVAVGSARPYPITLDRLLAWTGTLNAKGRSEEHTSELQSLKRTSYAVFCSQKKNQKTKSTLHNNKIDYTNQIFKSYQN